MDCPRCSVEMQDVVKDDATLQRCSECGGLWIDSVDLNRVLLHANLPALSAVGGFLNAEEIAGSCPACRVDLVAVEGGEKRSLHYDTCESCGGIWIDGPDEDEVPETLDWKGAEKEIVEFYRAFRKK